MLDPPAPNRRAKLEEPGARPVATKELFCATTPPAGRRTARDRLEAIPAAMARRADFLDRAAAAERDSSLLRLADLMAEAIGMELEARGLSVVGKDGRSLVDFEEIAAAHCARAAQEAYRRVRGIVNG